MKTILPLICSLLLLCSTAFANEPTSVNINTASVEMLTQLEGVGPTRAEAIVAWREANGDFVSVDQLSEVQGIGAATIEANRESVTLE